MSQKTKHLKIACYCSNISMSVVANLPPLLFLIFREQYQISFTVLGALILVNFCTQLGVDLLCTAFARHISAKRILSLTPYLTALGLGIFSLVPLFFPRFAVIGIFLGVFIFASSCGLCEVYISPVIAALPAENPDREMSKLHSIYAWGVVGMVMISTLFLQCFGTGAWHYLALLWMTVPMLAAFFFARSEFPEMGEMGGTEAKTPLRFSPVLLLCFFGIFFGGASENIMSQWASGYLEEAVALPKLWGDILGVACFALCLGLGRSAYAKYGKHLTGVLFFGGIAAVLCYLITALSSFPVLILFACALTGLCTSMMWPGNLTVASGYFPRVGVSLFALMAAGGDFGASVGPQLVGWISDRVAMAPWGQEAAIRYGISATQVGMRVGMLCGVCFPLCATLLFGCMFWKSKKEKRSPEIS